MLEQERNFVLQLLVVMIGLISWSVVFEMFSGSFPFSKERRDETLGILLVFIRLTRSRYFVASSTRLGKQVLTKEKQMMFQQKTKGFKTIL